VRGSVSHGPAEPARELEPARESLRGGAVPGVLLVTAVVVLGGVESGVPGVLGGVVGGGLALAAMSVGPLLVSWSSGRGPGVVMGSAVGGYTVTVLVLGVAFVALAGVSWVSSSYVAAALIAGATGCSVGQVRAAYRSRVPIFADRAPGDTGAREPRDDARG
jgi:ATP synthase protein I